VWVKNTEAIMCLVFVYIVVGIIVIAMIHDIFGLVNGVVIVFIIIQKRAVSCHA